MPTTCWSSTRLQQQGELTTLVSIQHHHACCSIAYARTKASALEGSVVVANLLDANVELALVQRLGSDVVVAQCHDRRKVLRGAELLLSIERGCVRVFSLAVAVPQSHGGRGSSSCQLLHAHGRP